MPSAEQHAINAGISLLDQAHAQRIRGATEDALRACVAILDQAPDHLGAAMLALELVLPSGRSMVMTEVAERLVDAYVRRGDLPSATTAAQLGLASGKADSALFSTIADAFGRGSARVGPVSMAPPPLPVKGGVDAKLARLKGDALIDRADDALQRFLATNDELPAGAAVPKLPLFSSLSPKLLLQLLRTMKLRDVNAGAHVVHEGDEGHEAFVVVRGMVKAVRESEGGLMLAALGPGALFGEMALVSDAPRAASVVAVEPVQLLVAERADLEYLAASEKALGQELSRFCYERMIANLVRHSRFLGAVDPGQRHEVVNLFERRSYEPGDRIVSQGQDADALRLIASGGVEVRRRDEDGDTVVVAQLGPGEVVGEISLVLRRPASADVVVRHPSVVLELPSSAFQDVIKAHPGLLGELYEMATSRDDELRSVVAQEALDVDDVLL